VDGAIGLDEAWARLATEPVAATGVESVALRSAAGQVLAATIVAPCDLPGFDSVALDGFALRAADASTGEPARLRLLPGAATAGAAWEGKLGPGEAVRALTGAPLPAGADTVVMREDCAADDDTVLVPASPRPGGGWRSRAEDVAAGVPVLRSGTRLGPQHLALAAALGLDRLPVRRRLRVALLSTGDELREPGAAPAGATVFDANRPMLRALLAGLPVTVTDLGILPDRRPAVGAALLTAAADHDIVLASGGASASEADHVVACAAELGALAFHGLRLKPGRPLAVGRIGACRFVGLPGNPVAAFVAAVLLARPFVLALAGAGWMAPRGLPVPAGLALTKRPDRAEALRVTLHEGPDGPRARLVPHDRSASLTSLAAADGLVLLEEKRTEVRPGEPVPYLSWASLGVTG
jgi:molybdopterin molybdotransferase